MKKLILLLLMASACSAAAPLNVTTRKLYVTTAESEKEAAWLDRLYAAFKLHLTESPQFQFIPIEEVQAQVQQVVLSDWHRLGADQLAALQQRYNLQVFLFFNLVKTASGFAARITACEFPSHVFIDSLEIAVDLRDQDVERQIQRLQPLLTSIYRKRTPYGFPITPAQKGIILATSRFPNALAISAAVQTALAAAPTEMPEFVCPVIALPDDAEESIYKTVLSKLAAQAIVFGDSGHHTLLLPTSSIQKTALDNTLPLWPPLPGFSRFNIAADSAYLARFARSLFPRRVLGETDEENDRALLLRKIQTLETDTLGGNSLHGAQLQGLYRRLLATFSQNEREFGWVELNFAHRLHQRGDPEAEAHWVSAIHNFQKLQGPLGAMLAGSYLATLYETLGRLNDAERVLKEALAVAEAFPDDAAAAFFNYRLGNICFAADRRMEAWQRLGAGVDGYLALGDTLKAAQIYTKMGILMRQSNSPLKSKEYLEKALELAQTVGDERETAFANYQLGVTGKELFEEEALVHFEAAADGMELLGDVENLANCEEHIGDLLARKGQSIAALHSYEAAVRFYRRSGRVEDAVRALVKCADIAAQREVWLRAQKLYDDALSLVDQSPSPWGAVILYKKGLAHIGAGELELGERELAQARQSTTVDLNRIEGFMQNLLRQLENELNSLNGAGR